MSSNKTRTTQFIKNIIGSAFLQVVTIVTGFISPKLMLTAFGSEINGITTSIMQFISYISLVEAGLANATVFALYKPLADGNKKERDSIVNAARITYNRTGMVFLLLAGALAGVYPFIASTTALSKIELSGLVLVLCSQTAINYFLLAKYRTILTADQCGYIISFASCVQLILHLLLVYVAIRCGLSVIWVRAIGTLALFSASFILSITVKRKYGNINFKEKPNFAALNTRKAAMFNQIMGVVAGGAPVVIMTTMVDMKQISVYSIYNMIAGSIATCLTVFTSGLSASFGNIYASGDQKLVAKTTDEFRTGYYYVLSIIYTIALVTLVPFVTIYTEGITDVNYIVPSLGILIILRGLIENLFAPHGMLIQSFGKFHAVKRQTLTKTIIVVFLGWLLTMHIGLNGMMIAMCIAYTYMLIELLYITPKHLVEMSVKKNVLQIAVMFAILFFEYFLSIRIGYVPTSYGEWTLYACIVGIFTVILTTITFAAIDKDNMLSLARRIIQIAKRT